MNERPEGRACILAQVCSQKALHKKKSHWAPLSLSAKRWSRRQEEKGADFSGLLAVDKAMCCRHDSLYMATWREEENYIAVKSTGLG
jgi:hypothetical protein